MTNCRNMTCLMAKNDPEDYGLKEKIKSIKTPLDKAIDISPYLKEN